MKLTYTNVNGYLIPNLTYKSGEQMVQLGKYGFLRRDYLKNHRNSTYQVMLLQDTILNTSVELLLKFSGTYCPRMSSHCYKKYAAFLPRKWLKTAYFCIEDVI